MPNVLNEFAGDGVTRTFNFSMTGGYLSRDYVYFFTRPNDDLLNYTPYNDDDVTWLTDFSVRTANPIPVGTTFVILRSTTLDPLVDFQNTSRITEKNLDTATWQSIHIAAETSDTVGRIQVVATNAKEESALALTLAQEAADDAASSANNAQQAGAAAASALSASQVAQQEAIAAALSADQAVTTAAQAESTAIAASATAQAASAAAATANSTANAATTAAANATTTANNAQAVANSASGTANSANSTAIAASAAASSATSTANQALTTANEAKALIDEAVAGAVISFNGRAGAVIPAIGDYTPSMVGLGNVNNTTDADKPVSTAQAAAIALKADKTYVDAQLNTKADKDLTNAALAQKADTSYVDSQLSTNSTNDRNRANHTGTQAMSTISGLSAALTTQVGVESINGTSIGGTKNAIINGAMVIAHEDTQVATAFGAYAVDMWGAFVSNQTTHAATASRIDLNNDATMRPLGLFDALRLARTTTSTITSTDYIAVQYPMEGNDMRRFIGNTFTFSFWVRANKTGPLTVAFRSGKANRSYYQTVNITQVSTWTRVVMTVTGGLPTEWINNESVTGWRDNMGLQICFVGGVGSSLRNGANGVWYSGNFLAPAGSTNLLTTSGDTLDITGVQMELGSTATAFEHERYNDTLKRLNRYVYIIDSFVMLSNGSLSFQGSAHTIQFPVRMPRTDATVLVTKRGGTAGAITPAALTRAGCVFTFTMSEPAGNWGEYTAFFRCYSA